MLSLFALQHLWHLGSGYHFSACFVGSFPQCHCCLSAQHFLLEVVNGRVISPGPCATPWGHLERLCFPELSRVPGAESPREAGPARGLWTARFLGCLQGQPPLALGCPFHAHFMPECCCHLCHVSCVLQWLEVGLVASLLHPSSLLPSCNFFEIWIFKIVMIR